MNRREIVEGWTSKLRGSVRFDSCVAVRFFGKIMNRNDDAIKRLLRDLGESVHR